MKIPEFDANKFQLSMQMGEVFEWAKWVREIPYIQWPDTFEVKIVPPTAGAIVRFLIRDVDFPSTWVSAYLDCYDVLGWYGEPYWEIFPANNGDTLRFDMNDVDGLIEGLIDAIDEQIYQIESEELI